MTLPKTVKLAALSGAVLITLGGAGAVLAATSATSSESLASRIATKIGFPQEDVQKVLDAQREVRHEDMQTRMSERLDTLVSEGKITAEQKQLILDKQKELQAEHDANHEELKSLTTEERRAKMEERRAELEQWAKDNGIDISYLRPFGKGMGGHGHRGGVGGVMF
jgi:hypothetical protein